MNNVNTRLIFCFIVALCLTIMPLPIILMGFRPAWILILILYIQFYLPNHFSIAFVFLIGLMLDALLSTIIGEHVLALIIVTWIASNKSKRFYFFSISQQMALIGFLILFYQSILLLIDAFAGFSTNLLYCVGSTFLTVLIWPWVRLFGQQYLLSILNYSK